MDASADPDRSPNLIFRLRLADPSRIEYISGAVEQILGYSPQEFYDEPYLFSEVMDEGTLAELLDDETTNPTCDPRTFSLRQKDGSDAWLEGMLISTFDDAGRPASVEGIARPVTVQHLLAERAQAAEMLATTRHAAATIAHDLNEALTAVAGHAALLADAEPWGSPERADVEAIRRAAKRAQTTTKRLAAIATPPRRKG